MNEALLIFILMCNNSQNCMIEEDVDKNTVTVRMSMNPTFSTGEIYKVGPVDKGGVVAIKSSTSDD